ncbi:unnamed protein product, partial [Effrenium voratum]
MGAEQLLRQLLRGSDRSASAEAARKLLALPRSPLRLGDAELCRAVWRLGRLPKEPEDADGSGWVGPLLRRLQGQVAPRSCRDCGDVAWAFARQRLLQEEVLLRLMRTYQRCQPGDPVSLANLLWAVASARAAAATAPAAAWPVEPLLKAHGPVLRAAQGAELARILWALGSLRVVHSVFHRCTELGEAKTQDLANVVWALSRVRWPLPSELLRRLEAAELALPELVATLSALAE